MWIVQVKFNTGCPLVPVFPCKYSAALVASHWAAWEVPTESLNFCIEIMFSRYPEYSVRFLLIFSSGPTWPMELLVSPRGWLPKPFPINENFS